MPNPNDPSSYVGTGIPYPQGELREQSNENPYAFMQSGITNSPAFAGFDTTIGTGYGRFKLGTQLKRLDTGETVTVRDPKETFNLNYIQLLGGGEQSMGQGGISGGASDGVDTSQPSPQTVSPTFYTGGAQPLAGIQQTLAQLQQSNLGALTPQQRQQLTGTLQGFGQTLDRYRQTFQRGAPQGVNLNDAGAARQAIGSSLPPQAQIKEPTQIDLAAASAPADPFFQELMTTWREYMSPSNQRTSLTQEYKNLLAESGLESLDTELLNMKNVIEGTEDDIRNEVTKAGGFATDSQVLALTNARNKQLIKNYNTLLDTRNQKADYVNTLIGLEAQDRKELDSRFDRMMNFGFQMVDYQNRMQNNARASYQKLLDNFGPQGVLAAIGNDSYGLAYAEQSLGLGSGGLQRLASLPPAPPTEEEQLDLEYKRVQIANLYSQIAEREDNGTIMVDTGGKVVLKPQEALKINKELVSNDAYKTIRKSQDSLQFLLDFEESFHKYGLQSLPGKKKGELATKYQTTLLNLKEFFNLGVLNGPDLEVLEGIMPNPTKAPKLFGFIPLSKKLSGVKSATEAGIQTLKQNIEITLDDRYSSLASQYGDYSPYSLNSLRDLQRIYIEQKIALNPQIRQMIEDNPDFSVDDIISIIIQ